MACGVSSERRHHEWNACGWSALPRGICRAAGVSLKWLLGFLVHCLAALPDHLHVQPVICDGDVMMRRLAVEADAMASFVQKKANKQWVWSVMAARTRQIVASHVGDRSHKSAEPLWAKLPQAYRQRNTKRSANERVKPITSNVSTIR